MKPAPSSPERSPQRTSVPFTERIRTFVSELKRRRVVRVAVIYIVAAFGALQGADVLVPALYLPDRTMTLLVILAIAGLPLALAAAWVFDLAPGGIERTPALPDPSSPGAPEPEDAVGPHGEGPPGPGNGVGQGAPGAVLPAAATSTAGPTVAVLPFLNMSPHAENEYFADGITEDVIAQLSKIHALTVISRTSVMPFKKREPSLQEISAALGATTLLDGSVRRVGDRVRIVAQLVDARTDRHLWAETYDRELTDIFAIQSDVALHIAAALEAKLSPDERTRIRKKPTSSLQAYQLYLHGRHDFIRFTPDGLKRAIEYFERAVARDPAYALAYATIAMAYAELAESGAMPPDEARPRATQAASEALRIDPALGEAHCAMAYLMSLWEFDWEGAEAAFRRAIDLTPNNADAHDLYGRMCAAIGRFDDALALARRAQELDPLAHRLDVATILLRAGRYHEAEVEAARAVELDPDQDRARATKGWALLKQDRVDEGLAEIERAVEVAPGNAQWLAQLGQARAMAGRIDGAREILHELEARAASGFVAPYHLAFVHTGLGDHERAIDLLERAFDERAGSIYGIKGSFLFAPLRSHPRFQALLARMNL
jgi:adenylate cyclase